MSELDDVGVCPTCMGYGEVFSHADDCFSDDCALALGIDDCDGRVDPCLSCSGTGRLPTPPSTEDAGHE